MAKSARERKREIKWIGRNDLAGKYPPLMVTDATISITLLGSAHIIYNTTKPFIWQLFVHFCNICLKKEIALRDVIQTCPDYSPTLVETP